MILLCHIVITSYQWSWLTSSVTLLPFWTELMKILWKKSALLLYIHQYSVVSCFLHCCSLILLKSSSLQGTMKSSLAAWAENVSWYCLNRRRLTADLWALCSSPPSCSRLLRLCHTLSSSTPMHRCVTNKYSNYRRESQGPAQSQITVINDQSGSWLPMTFICTLLVGVCMLWMSLLGPGRVFSFEYNKTTHNECPYFINI